MNSPTPRSYPKRGQRTAVASYSSNRRGQRRSAGIPSRTHPNSTTSGATTTTTSQKWTRVMRNPISPLDEPYFGSSPTASFQVPTWVRVSDLTAEEKAHYDAMVEKQQAVTNKSDDRNDEEVNESSELVDTDKEKVKEPLTTNESKDEVDDGDKACANTGDEGGSDAQPSSDEVQTVMNMNESLHTNVKDKEEANEGESSAQPASHEEQAGVNEVHEDNNDQSESETKQTHPNSMSVETHGGETADEIADEIAVQPSSDEPQIGVGVNKDYYDFPLPMQKKQKLSDSAELNTEITD